MFQLLKSVHVYIKFSRNTVEVTNLRTGETSSREAIAPFSSVRNIVGTFKEALSELNAK